MKRMITLLTALLLMSWSVNVWAFACRTAGGETIPVGGGNANVYVTLAPKINVGENLAVDLSTQIFCHNDSGHGHFDYVVLDSGSAYGELLSSFSSTVRYNGIVYPFPTINATAKISYYDTEEYAWPVQLYIKPKEDVGGVRIKSGDLIASLILRQTNNFNDDNYAFTWKIYALNDVVVPTGTCDVSARDVTVTLPDYPGSTPIPLTVYCSQGQSVYYSLSGTTAGPGGSIFTNTASTLPAQGIGVQLTRNGSVVPVNSEVSLGTVNTSVSLGLTAEYARTTGPLTAGNVQSIIGVTFVYH